MKLPKLWLSVFGLFFIGLGTAVAQEVEGPVDTDDINNPGIEYNEAQKSFGIMNFLTSSVQRPSDVSESTNNVAIIEQVGGNNTARLDQDGSNIYGVIIQDGTGNTADVWQKGSNLESIINMQGNNNFLKFDQTASNRNTWLKFEGNMMEYDATQTNTGFTLTPKSSTKPVLEISRNTQTIPLIISNN
jgi:hypothetical protein